MEKVPDLASVLDQHLEAIAEAWIDAIDRQLPASRLCSIARERRQAAILIALRGLINGLPAGHQPDVAGLALAAASEMVQLGVGVDEVLEAILLAKDAALPCIWRAYPPGSQTALSAIGQFDAVLRRAARLFVNAYAQVSRRLREHQRRKAEEMAVLRERTRLAREMHDEMAQAVGYLHVQASLTHELLSAGEMNRAKMNLQDMKEVAGHAYDEVTEAVFSLRTKAPGGAKFLPTLRKYLAQYGAYYQLDACLVVDDESAAMPSDAVASQLLFIIREALTNVRKHSEADEATVRLQQGDASLCITVEDNGCGFDPSQIAEDSTHHFGLQIMRERAECIGGSLVVASQPGCGTRVTISLPQKNQ